MSLDRTPLTARTADDFASLDDINDAYDAINNLKASACDMADGKINSDTLEIKTNATTAGNRSLKFCLTASNWVRLFWDNTSALFKLQNQAGTLQPLELADAATTTQAATKGQLDAAINALQLEVTGAIKQYAGTTSPTGYLLCDGTAISRTTYAALYTVVGTSFGAGDGSTTFNIPDLRGRLPLGKDNMGGTAASRVTSASTGGSNATILGGTGGAQTHTLSTAEMPSHTHTYTAPNTPTAFTTSGGGASGVTTVATSTNSGSAGSGNAHSNTPPWIALNYIIKT